MGVMFVRNNPNFPGMTRLESIFVWMRKSYLFRACFTLPFCCPASRIGNTHTARLHQFLDQPLRAHNQLAPLPLDLRHPRPSPSVIAEKLKLTQKLLILINADRTARGPTAPPGATTRLPGMRPQREERACMPGTWSIGASVTPAQMDAARANASQMRRISYTDYGENIANSGPYPGA